MGHSHMDAERPSDFAKHLVPPRLAADVATREEVDTLRAQLTRATAELAAERAARDEADRANRAKMDFLARLSHDLRTPLNAIAGYADLLLSGVRGPLTPEQRLDVERIQRSERHLLALIATTLDYAKLELGHVRYEIADVPVRPLLSEAEAIVAPFLRQRNLTLTVLPTARGLTVRADPEKTRQVLINLLANAIKFTDTGGRIVMSAADDGSHIAIRVTDFGRGIPQEQLAAIFEPYVQLSPAAAQGTGATGLGLAIARDLVQGMGGDIVVTSTVDMGSSFVVHLPTGTHQA